MSRGRSTSSGPRRGGANVATSNSWIITLPVELRGNDAGLRITAANLLELATVRSVIIDGSRSEAVVRLHADCENGSDPGNMPTLRWSEPATSLDAAEAAVHSVVAWTDPRDRSLCFVKLPPRARGWRRALLMVAAGAALWLGLLGVLLPGLPTTPFVLIASYCLLRSSPRLHARLLDSRLFGGVLRDWHLHRGIRSHVRYKATAVIALVLGASLVVTTIPLVAKFIILAIAACGVTYVWRLPAISQRMSAAAPLRGKNLAN